MLGKYPSQWTKLLIVLSFVVSSRQFVPSAVSLSNLLWVVSNLLWVEISFCPIKYVLSKSTGSHGSHFLKPCLLAAFLLGVLSTQEGWNFIAYNWIFIFLSRIFMFLYTTGWYEYVCFSFIIFVYLFYLHYLITLIKIVGFESQSTFYTLALHKAPWINNCGCMGLLFYNSSKKMD